MLQRGMNWTEVATRAKHAVDGLTVIEHCTDCWLLRRLWMLQMQHAQNCRKLPATSRLQYRDTAFEAEWKIAVGKLLKEWFPKPVATCYRGSSTHPEGSTSSWEHRLKSYAASPHTRLKHSGTEAGRSTGCAEGQGFCTSSRAGVARNKIAATTLQAPKVPA